MIIPILYMILAFTSRQEQIIELLNNHDDKTLAMFLSKVVESLKTMKILSTENFTTMIDSCIRNTRFDISNI